MKLLEMAKKELHFETLASKLGYLSILLRERGVKSYFDVRESISDLRKGLIDAEKIEINQIDELIKTIKEMDNSLRCDEAVFSFFESLEKKNEGE